MKRYLVFAGDTCYPAGGWGDFVGTFDLFDEANAVLAKNEEKGRWAHIVDLAYLEIAHQAEWAPDWYREMSGA